MKITIGTLRKIIKEELSNIHYPKVSDVHWEYNFTYGNCQEIKHDIFLFYVHFTAVLHSGNLSLPFRADVPFILKPELSFSADPDGQYTHVGVNISNCNEDDLWDHAKISFSDQQTADQIASEENDKIEEICKYTLAESNDFFDDIDEIQKRLEKVAVDEFEDDWKRDALQDLSDEEDERRTQASLNRDIYPSIKRSRY